MADQLKKCSRCNRITEPNRILCARCKEMGYIRSTRAREKRMVAGLCARNGCGRPPEINRTYCSACLEDMSRRGIARTKERKQRGLCRRCGRPAESGKVHCAVCLEKDGIRKAKVRERRKSAQLCVRCGGSLQGLDRVYCTACLEAGRNHYQLNKEARLIQIKQYRHKRKKKHPELVKMENRIKRSRYRSLVANAPVNDLTKVQVDILFATQEGCFYCGRDDEPLTIEHLVPLSRGGDHSISNIVLACMDCNRSKGAKTVDEFITYQDVTECVQGLTCSS